MLGLVCIVAHFDRFIETRLKNSIEKESTKTREREREGGRKREREREREREMFEVLGFIVFSLQAHKTRGYKT